MRPHRGGVSTTVETAVCSSRPLCSILDVDANFSQFPTGRETFHTGGCQTTFGSSLETLIAETVAKGANHHIPQKVSPARKRPAKPFEFGNGRPEQRSVVAPAIPSICSAAKRVHYRNWFRERTALTERTPQRSRAPIRSVTKRSHCQANGQIRRHRERSALLTPRVSARSALSVGSVDL
jgi:hypothetical protein